MSSEPTISQMNEAIAKFWGGLKVPHPSLGHPHYGYYTPFGWYNENNIKYHSSWDWLMPVIKRVREMHSGILKTVGGGVSGYIKAAGEMNRGLISCDIDKAHAGLYKFIQWYNQSTQNNEQTTTG